MRESLTMLEADDTPLTAELPDELPATDAQPRPHPTAEPWCVAALVSAGLGAIPLTWPVPILSLLAVGLALVGLRNCQLDGRFSNRWMAVAALAAGLIELALVVVLTGLHRIDFAGQ